MLFTPRELYPMVAIRPEIKAGKVQWAIGEAVKRLARDARCFRTTVSVTPAVPLTSFAIPTTNLPDSDVDVVLGVHRLYATINSVDVEIQPLNETMYYKNIGIIEATPAVYPSGWFSNGGAVTLSPPVSTLLTYKAYVSYCPGGDDPADRTYELPADAAEAIAAYARSLVFSLPGDTDGKPGDVKIITMNRAEYASYMSNCKNVIELGENDDAFMSGGSFVGFKR